MGILSESIMQSATNVIGGGGGCGGGGGGVLESRFVSILFHFHGEF